MIEVDSVDTTSSETGLPTGAVGIKLSAMIYSTINQYMYLLLPSSLVVTVIGVVYGPSPTIVWAATEHK